VERATDACVAASLMRLRLIPREDARRRETRRRWPRLSNLPQRCIGAGGHRAWAMWVDPELVALLASTFTSRRALAVFSAGHTAHLCFARHDPSTTDRLRIIRRPVFESRPMADAGAGHRAHPDRESRVMPASAQKMGRHRVVMVSSGQTSEGVVEQTGVSSARRARIGRHRGLSPADDRGWAPACLVLPT